MNLNNESVVRRVRDGQRGQSLVMLPILLVFLLAAAALVVDMGGLYYSYQDLQDATQAAALAGAQALPNSTATTIATNYSAVTGGLNARPNLLNVTMVSGYPLLECLTSTGVPCSAPANANAIVVKEQATVRTYFAKVFGVSSLTITSTATASAPGPGGANGPFNVMIVVDTTYSMTNMDTDSNCSTTRINCALAGVQTLLGTLWPCASKLTSCGTVTNGNVPNPIDEVGLMVFPGLTSASQVQDDTNCSGTAPAIALYDQTSPGPPVYQIVSSSSDFRTSDTATALSATSNIVKAVGGASGCNPLTVVGGVGTYYADVITAAQTALITTYNQRLAGGVSSQNVLILLSDGNAGAAATVNGQQNLPPGEVNNQCHEAITAAQAAANATPPTWVYAVAYGAEASGCSTDTGSNAITPCQTMEDIASSPSRFFSDYTAKGGTSTCIGRSQSTTSLNQIFKQIGGDLTFARLIPNGTT
jgi:Flp pilus assembly protein TadG